MESLRYGNTILPSDDPEGLVVNSRVGACGGKFVLGFLVFYSHTVVRIFRAVHY
jgi:hypothetical protein